MTLNELGEEILKINRVNGWNVPEPEWWHSPHGTYRIPTSLALVHSEVSEALEEFRKDHNLDHFLEELADVMIRTLELGVGLGGDMDAAIAAKLEKNRGRAHRHGGRLV